ncbi:MAG: hypothetical protein MI748_03500 [Opitutales bacterium]|nr:hypothetical protein [Opitutales bacterium]
MITKAVVPIAGLGTRLFPASHAFKKEMFPIVAPDGIARALLHYQIKDLVEAGIQEICIITQPGEQEMVLDYFKGPGDVYLKRLEKYPHLRSEADEMASMADRLYFVEQTEQEGFGHAIYQSKRFAAESPVLMCLGDHLFRGKEKSCHLQLIERFQETGGRSVSAVNKIAPEELRGYGTISGKRRMNNRQLVDVDLIIEKPDIPTARVKLRVDGLENDEFLGWFGMHALAPSIYEVLERMIRDDIRQGGEFQMTYAQELQRQEEGYCAYEMLDGQRFDFGIPADFVTSVTNYAKE